MNDIIDTVFTSNAKLEIILRGRERGAASRKTPFGENSTENSRICNEILDKNERFGIQPKMRIIVGIFVA